MRRVAVAVAAAAVAALVLAPGAAAHLSVTPGVVEQGRTATLLVELPQLRPGAAPRELAVAGDGVRQLSVAREAGGAPESRWRVRLRVDAVPGTIPLVLHARFADGAQVEVQTRLTVVPPADDGAPSAAVLAGAAAAALAAVAGAALLLRRARRRT